MSKNEQIAAYSSNYFNDKTKGINIKKRRILDKFSNDPLLNAIQR